MPPTLIQLKKYLQISLGLHIALVIFVLVAPSVVGFLPKPTPKITWVNLTKGTGENPSDASFKKAKNLPDSTIREQKDFLKNPTKDKVGKDSKSQTSEVKQKAPDSNKQTSPNGGMQFKKEEAERDQAIDDALKKVQEQLQKRQVDIEAAQVTKEGTGQSPEGTIDAKGETNPVLAAYYQAIKRKINEQWITTPKQLGEGQNPKAQITLLISAEGAVISTSFDQKSGDESFDLSAMRAIERAAPFPPPPEEIKGEALTEGFLIEFNPRNIAGQL